MKTLLLAGLLLAAVLVGLFFYFLYDDRSRGLIQLGFISLFGVLTWLWCREAAQRRWLNDAERFDREDSQK